MVKSTVWVASLTIVYRGKCILRFIDRRISTFRGGSFFEFFVPELLCTFLLPSCVSTNKCPFLEEKRGKKERKGGGSSFPSKTWRNKSRVPRLFRGKIFELALLVVVVVVTSKPRTHMKFEWNIYMFVENSFLLPLLAPRGTRSRNGILISKEIFGHLEIGII